MSSAWFALIGAAALAMPTAPAGQRHIMVSFCGQPGVTLSIPIDEAPVDDQGSCRDKACHAGCEWKRRLKPGQSPS